MHASVVGLNAVRDLVARAAWALPHDVRRDLYRRVRPGGAELHDTMRAHLLGELDGLTVSLRPAEELGAIFVHVPKTGGTSVGRALFEGYAGNHMPIGSYQLVYDRADFERLFRFGFVRNPYDRLVSSYEFVLHGATRLDGRVEAERTGDDQTLRKPSPGNTIETFEDIEHFVLTWLTPGNARSLEHFRPQHRFVCDPAGRPGLDLVGRFERLGEDFARIAERLGVQAALPHDRRTISRTTDATTYVDRFTPAMRRVVEQVYGEDLRRFDYAFGD